MMQLELYDVLVVDDVSSAAEDFARLIFAQTGLKTIYTSSAKDAIDIVQRNDIKVLVLDQVMPEKTGTELLKELRVYTDAKALMLTGEASKEDLANAINLKFDAHLDKALITNLSDNVVKLYAQFESEFRAKIEQSKSLKSKYTWCKLKLYKTILLFDKVIRPSYVDLNKVETLLTIFSGQEQETKSEIVAAEEFVIEQSHNFDMKFDMDLPIQEIVAKLGHSIAKSLKKITTVKNNKTYRKKSKYHLTEKDSELVDHRTIIYAPIYEIRKMLIGYKNPLIGGKYRRCLMIVRKFTGEYQLFQKDYLKDGSVNEKELSIQKF